MYDAPIHYVVLNMKDYTFTVERMEQHCEILDKIRASEGPGVVVTVSSSPKIFSTGFNLEYWEDKF